MTEPVSYQCHADGFVIEVRWDIAAARPEVAATRLVALLDEHPVVLVRTKRPVSDEHALAVMAALGPVIEATGSHGLAEKLPGVQTVLTDERSGRPAPHAVWPAAGLPFHNDFSYLAQPAQWSMLDPIELPACGQGDTTFVDMTQALECMEPDWRRQLDTARSVTVLAAHVAAEMGCEPGTMSAPVVVEHPRTGQAVLWVGPEFGRIDHAEVDPPGPSRSEIVDHCVQQARQYCHRWRAGDLVIFDNVATMHGRGPMLPTSRRQMRQISTQLAAPLRAYC